MNVGVEIDFVVEDCLKALALYQSIFEVEAVEATNNETGMNEAEFSIYSARFHMLDENPAYMLIAPKPGDPKPMWVNVFVADISQTYDKAMSAGCTQIQPITENEAMGLSNAMFIDPFGYIWMLHQQHRETSFADREKIAKEQMGTSE